MRTQIKDLLTIRLQQTEKNLIQLTGGGGVSTTDRKKVRKGPQNDLQPFSYEAFFKNPSGQSDNIFEEDDLIQNQNKSATAIMDQDDEYQ